MARGRWGGAQVPSACREGLLRLLQGSGTSGEHVVDLSCECGANAEVRATSRVAGHTPLGRDNVAPLCIQNAGRLSSLLEPQRHHLGNALLHTHMAAAPGGGMPAWAA